MPLGIATRHPGGMADNSPTFQRWGLDRRRVRVPKGRLKLCPWSAVPSGLIARSDGVPNVETSKMRRERQIFKISQEIAIIHFLLLTKPNFFPISCSGNFILSILLAASRKILRW